MPQEARKLGLCRCAKQSFCWSLMMSAYRRTVKLELDEIEAAFPNRFFPDSMASALGKPDAEGNFVSVRCGADRQPCDDKRDELEKRVMLSSFLAVAGSDKKQDGELFDPETWEIRGSGQALMSKAKKCRPGLMRELADEVLHGKAK